MPSIHSLIFRSVLTMLLASALSGSAALSQTLPSETRAERDTRMAWWRAARFGMFIHWGVYSVPARGEWVMYNEKIPVAEYEKFPPQFNPLKFDALEWVSIAKAAGVRYIVITSKHHDGFCMWDSKVTTYDIMDATPFKRDVLKELAAACKQEGIRLCFYYSIMDWHHPDAHGQRFARYRDEYMKPQLKELLRNYGPLGVLWFDGQWIAEWDEAQGRALYAELRTLQPDLIINNRIGKGINDNLGDPSAPAQVGDFGTPEQYIPGTDLEGVDWESCMTMNDHWGYAARDTNWKTPKVLVRNLADIASKGGNYLLNVGPTAEGEIPRESVARLREIGRWLGVNGASIYGTKASPFESTPWGRCTSKLLPGGMSRLYLHVFEWPTDGKLRIPGLGSDPARAVLLAQPSTTLALAREGNDVVVTVPRLSPDTLDPVVALEFPGAVLTYHRPAIHSPAPIFLNDMNVTLSVPSDELEIRYTLDGKNPDSNSGICKGPLVLTASATLKAQTYHRGKAVSAVVEQRFMKVAPQPSVNVGGAVPGLAYEYFEGDWKSLPDFDSLVCVAKGTAPVPGTDVRRRDEKYGLRFSGFLTVPVDGVYRFVLKSDDGSRLDLDGSILIDNDSLHSAVEKQACIALAKGMHPITVMYFNNLWEGELSVRMALAGEPLARIPPESLSHVTKP